MYREHSEHAQGAALHPGDQAPSPSNSLPFFYNSWAHKVADEEGGCLRQQGEFRSRQSAVSIGRRLWIQWNRNKVSVKGQQSWDRELPEDREMLSAPSAGAAGGCQ